jgi:hypothetical protein
MYGVYMVFLAGKPPYIRSYTVQINSSGQPYMYTIYYLHNPSAIACGLQSPVPSIHAPLWIMFSAGTILALLSTRFDQ